MILNFNVKFIKIIQTQKMSLQDLMFFSTLEFKDLQIVNGEEIAAKKQTIKNSPTQEREFQVSLGMNK